MLLHVDFTAVPKAKAEWFFNDQPLTSGRKVNIEGSDSHTVLSVGDLKPEDAGQYKLKVTNKAGTQEATFDVNVRGK